MLAQAMLVASGGALGSLGRFGLTLAAARLGLGAWPWATLAANLSGSLAIGAFAALALRSPSLGGLDLRLFWMVGICGGYTTFSAFSLQTLELLTAGSPVRAASYAALSVAGCVAATGLGFALAGGRG